MNFFYIKIIIIFLLISSCHQDVKKSENNKIDLATRAIINTDEKGKKKSQYLIVNYDTVHKILYDKNENITFNEGEYVSVEVVLSNKKKKEVEFNLSSIEIDTMKKAFVLYESTDGFNYDLIEVKSIDSTFFSYTHQFKDSIVDILVRTEFGGKGLETLFGKTTSPMIINFNKGTIDIKPEYLEKMKDDIKVRTLPR